VSVSPLSVAEAAETLPDGGGVALTSYRAILFGWWSRRGAREGRLIGGGSRSRVRAKGEDRVCI
jgi:hypothetical protein